MTFSLFGEKFTRHAGITRLMEDLNDGLRTPGAIMLGGGNPAQIPEMEAYFKQLLQEMLEQGKLTDALCNYDGPQGKDALLKALAKMLRDELGWEIAPQNIALTNGSQSAFFYLFNLFAGRHADGSHRRKSAVPAGTGVYRLCRCRAGRGAVRLRQAEHRAAAGRPVQISRRFRTPAPSAKRSA